MTLMLFLLQYQQMRVGINQSTDSIGCASWHQSNESICGLQYEIGCLITAPLCCNNCTIKQQFIKRGQNIHIKKIN